MFIVIHIITSQYYNIINIVISSQYKYFNIYVPNKSFSEMVLNKFNLFLEFIKNKYGYLLKAYRLKSTSDNIMTFGGRGDTTMNNNDEVYYGNNSMQ